MTDRVEKIRKILALAASEEQLGHPEAARNLRKRAALIYEKLPRWQQVMVRKLDEREVRAWNPVQSSGGAKTPERAKNVERPRPRRERPHVDFAIPGFGVCRGGPSDLSRAAEKCTGRAVEKWTTSEGW